HERTQRRVVLVLIVGLGQPQPRRRIDPVLNEWAFEAEEPAVAVPLKGGRNRWTERHVGEGRLLLRRRRLTLRASGRGHREHGSPLDKRTASNDSWRCVLHHVPHRNVL